MQKPIKKQSPFSMTMRRVLKNPSAVAGLVILTFLVLIAIFGDMLAPYNYAAVKITEKFQGPSPAHWFGTDQFGRDILSRVLVGTKYSLLLGLLNTTVSAIMGSSSVP